MSRPGRLFALALTLLWVGGIEVVPNLHVALHDRIGAHTHDASGAIVRVAFGDVEAFEPLHRHADGTLHGRARPAKQRSRDLAVRAPGDPGHGAGSLAHHAALWIAPPPPITHPLPVDLRVETVAATFAITPVSVSPGRAVARGPPIG